jgi:hypothetical protein
VTTLQVIVAILALAHLPAVAAWWYFGLYYLRGLRRAPVRLDPVAAWPAGAPAPALTVIIACHNEAAGIVSCLRGVLAQSYPNLRVLVADDRSTDETAALVRDLAAADSRLTLLEIRELPPGWTGKTHALAQAVQHTDTDYLLFIDSDVELSPEALNTVMQRVGAGELDFLSLWPRLDLRSFSERLLTPPALLLLSLWALPRRPDADIAAKVLLGNGQFMLFRRRTYDAIGGHAGVADELAEDAVLANRAHAAGARCWAGLGEGVYATYRTGGFGRTWHALARVCLGSVPQHWRLWASAQGLLGGGVAPAWMLPLAAACLAVGWHPWPVYALGLVALLQWLGMAVTLRRAFDMTLVRHNSLWWFPLGSLIVAGVLVWCSYLLSGRGTVRWGPTRYRVRGSRVVAQE